MGFAKMGAAEMGRLCWVILDRLQQSTILHDFHTPLLQAGREYLSYVRIYKSCLKCGNPSGPLSVVSSARLQLGSVGIQRLFVYARAALSIFVV